VRQARLGRLPLVPALLALSGCDGCFGGGVGSAEIDPVAEAVATWGDVRRRLADEAAWGSIGSGAKLFAGDWVQTAQRANARVLYDDGAELFVEPSTTVVIEARGAGSEEAGIRRIAVRSGAVRAGLRRGTRRPVEVELPDGETIAVSTPQSDDEAELRISVDPSGQADVAVTRGAVALTTSTGETVEVTSGTARRLQPGGAPGPVVALPVAPNLEPTVKSPPHYVGEEVPLRWTTPEADRRFLVELSSGNSLETFERLVEADAPRLDWTPDAPGTWDVRVYATDRDGRRSAPSNRLQIDVVVDDRLRLLARPADGTTYRVPAGTARVDFAWSPHPDGGPYRVTLARDPALTDVLTTEATDDTRWTARVPPGRYHWGVHRASSPPEPLFVRTRSFRVVRRGSELRVPRKLDWSRRK
jgi:hypothetical protein